jgi:hypothetical protein
MSVKLGEYTFEDPLRSTDLPSRWALTSVVAVLALGRSGERKDSRVASQGLQGSYRRGHNSKK